MAADDFEITATHLYVKFIPKNEEELDILMVDSTLVLYDYPLDYEIAVNGDYYRDPTIPEDQPTPQYCAVKVTNPFAQGTGKVKGNAKVMETVEKTILEELFIPDEDFDADENGTPNKTANPAMRKINGKMVSVALIDALVEEALRITNNLEKPSTQNKTAKTMSGSWRPAGRIRVWDDFLQDFVGVEGVQVRARRWFTTHRGWVGADGFYSCDGTFAREANYSIDWDRYDFAIQDHWLNGATFNGPKKEGNWDLNLNDDKQEQEYYATIFRAAHHYYYKDIKGLRRPPQNSFWQTKMKIKAFLENTKDGTLGNHKEERRFLGAQLKIYTYQRSAESTYSTVIHELAHASHWDMSRSNFDNSDPVVKESWASGVEWELTRMVYPFYYRPYSRFRYTGVVQDMIDGKKTTTSYYYWTNNNPWIELSKQYSDQVEGYTIKELEDALQGNKSWNDWKNNIINKYTNGTKTKLHDSFTYWNSL